MFYILYVNRNRIFIQVHKKHGLFLNIVIYLHMPPQYSQNNCIDGMLMFLSDLNSNASIWS